MPSIRRSTPAAVALATMLAVSATACGSTDDNADAEASASASATSGGSLKLPDTLPTSLEELEEWKEQWKNGEWKNWDKDKWLREAGDFINPVIAGLWDADRLRGANETPQVEKPTVPSDDGTTDAEPTAVQAQQLATPYHTASPATGKLFFDVPEGQAVCSATVVSDPANPGKSNLVWTAGHCVHAGAEGGWYRNLIFVPSYNDEGLTGAALNSASATDLAPYGNWWATENTTTTQQWIDGGGESDSPAFPYDVAVMKVTNPNSEKSLEETVGASIPVWFDAPTAEGIDSMQARGYPADTPFDGRLQYQCTDDPVRLSLAAGTPTMNWLGCTMTAGSSGGGWFAKQPDGTLALVSNTSIGPSDGARWLAGPHLGSEAKAVFEAVSGTS